MPRVTSRRRLLVALVSVIPTGCLRLTSTETTPAGDTTGNEPTQLTATTVENGDTNSPTMTATPTPTTEFTPTTAPTPTTESTPMPTTQPSESTASPTPRVAFERGSVNRDGKADGTDVGVIATIQDYAGASTVQILYRIPDQNAVLYRSERFSVSAVKQAGNLGPRQRDPNRKANQLMASDIDEDRAEHGIFEGEHVLVLFYNENETLINSVIYEVGTGTLEKTVTTPPTDKDDMTPTNETTTTASG